MHNREVRQGVRQFGGLQVADIDRRKRFRFDASVFGVADDADDFARRFAFISKPYSPAHRLAVREVGARESFVDNVDERSLRRVALSEGAATFNWDVQRFEESRSHDAVVSKLPGQG